MSFGGSTAPGDAVQAYVKSTFGHGSVPAVFVKGSLLGGCDSTFAADADGRLAALLA